MPPIQVSRMPTDSVAEAMMVVAIVTLFAAIGAFWVGVATLGAVREQISIAREELEVVKTDLGNNTEQFKEFMRKPDISLEATTQTNLVQRPGAGPLELIENFPATCRITTAKGSAAATPARASELSALLEHDKGWFGETLASRLRVSSR
jgi:hypothetical protein